MGALSGGLYGEEPGKREARKGDMDNEIVQGHENLRINPFAYFLIVASHKT